MSSTLNLAVIPGDGIGPEVVTAALTVLAATGVDATTTEYPFGAGHFLATGDILSEDDLAALANHDAILLGAVGGDPRDPRLAGGIIERGLLLKLRFAFHHYVNLRPTVLRPGVPSPLKDPGVVDFVVVREGTEGPYVGNGGAIRIGTPNEVANEVSINTAFGVERLVRFAFAEAMTRPRRHVTLVHKTNVLTHAGSLWQRTFDRVHREFPDVTTDYQHVDAATIHLVTNPARFDVIVTDNLFGDILTDLAAAISGGIGLAASGNINPDGTFPSMFEPVHGSAPDIAGKQLADPTAAILSVALMLTHTGHADAAAKVTAAVEADLAARGSAARSTTQVGADIAAAVAAAQHPYSSSLLRNTMKNLLAPRTLEFSVTPNDAARSAAEHADIIAEPGFGKHFTDHMVDICWSEQGGWHRPRVQPYGPIQLDPAAAVLHYAQEVFEGLKAYRHEDGSIWTFRPEMNAERLKRSARRLALPELPTEYFIESLRQLIAVDARWVPSAPDTSLYLRPFMFAKEAFLGVRPANKVNYYVIASPAGAYFSGGVAPVSIWISTDYARAGKGGTGAAKTGGNYASSLVAQQEAYDHGCAQVLFLDSEKGEYLEELGGMNVVFVYRDGRVVTPESASILEGITRDSVLQLAKDRGLKVEQRKVSITEVREGVASGDIVEMFACGTAAVIVPIAQFKADGYTIGEADAPAGELTMSLREELTDIQYGRKHDRHGWMTRLDVVPE